MSILSILWLLTVFWAFSLIVFVVVQKIRKKSTGKATYFLIADIIFSFSLVILVSIYAPPVDTEKDEAGNSPKPVSVSAPADDALEVARAASLKSQYDFYEASAKKLRSEMKLEPAQADEVFSILVQCGLKESIMYIFDGEDYQTKEPYYTVWYVGSASAKVYLDGNNVYKITQLSKQIYPVVESPEPSPSPIPTPTPTPKPTPSPSATPNADPSGSGGGGGGTNDAEPHFNDYDNPDQQNTVEYVLNTSTKRFHVPGCSDVKKIKSENYSTINSRDTAISNGYRPCKRCNP